MKSSGNNLCTFFAWKLLANLCTFFPWNFFEKICEHFSHEIFWQNLCTFFPWNLLAKFVYIFSHEIFWQILCTFFLWNLLAILCKFSSMKSVGSYPNPTFIDRLSSRLWKDKTFFCFSMEVQGLNGKSCPAFTDPSSEMHVVFYGSGQPELSFCCRLPPPRQFDHGLEKPFPRKFIIAG